MSLGFYPQFEPELRGAKFESLGEILAANMETLDEIAISAGLNPFTKFSNNRELPSDFDPDSDDLDSMLDKLETLLDPGEEWFDPADGCASMQALANFIKANPTAANLLQDQDGVIHELEDLVRVLSIAEREGVRFRLPLS